jgi:hypothetical protein
VKSYSWHEVFSPDEMKLYQRAVELVAAAPYAINGELVRCHELARAVATCLDLSDAHVCDGLYGSVDHSWLWTKPPPAIFARWNPSILDVYAPGVHPQVVLVDWYNHRDYRRGEPRKDIRQGIVRELVKLLGGDSCKLEAKNGR